MSSSPVWTETAHSPIYSSGLTPLILTALIGATGGSPWLACGYLVATAIISVISTRR